MIEKFDAFKGNLFSLKSVSYTSPTLISEKELFLKLGDEGGRYF